MSQVPFPHQPLRSSMVLARTAHADSYTHPGKLAVTLGAALDAKLNPSSTADK